MLGHLAGAGASGLLGQLSDVASSPRRAVWSMLGLPESGSELVGNMLGADASNPWIQGLGAAAEIVGDPLNLVGAPLLSRAGSLLSRLGPKYQGLLSRANVAGQGFADADRAMDLERAAMANRFNDITDIGTANLPSPDELAILSKRAARAKDGTMATETMPLKSGARMDPERLRGLQAMGLATPEGEVLTRLAEPRMMASGRLSGQHTIPAMHGEPLPWSPPPGDNPAMHGPMGFGPGTRSGYMDVLDERQQLAKNRLLESLGILEKNYDLKPLTPLEQAMLVAGSTSLGMPVGQELGR